MGAAAVLPVEAPESRRAMVSPAVLMLPEELVLFAVQLDQALHGAGRDDPSLRLTAERIQAMLPGRLRGSGRR